MDGCEKYGVSREELNTMFEFVTAMNRACKWKEPAFTCPGCGARVEIHTSSYNGHRHARCDKCGRAFME